MLKTIAIIIIALAAVSQVQAAVFNSFLDANKVIKKKPDELMQDYKNGKINSSQLWVKMPFEKKIEFIDKLKKDFREEDGVIIKKSSDYYALILENLYIDYPELLMESLKAIFAAVAIQQDDFYEEGMTINESIQKWFGETFVITYPEDK